MQGEAAHLGFTTEAWGWHAFVARPACIHRSSFNVEATRVLSQRPYGARFLAGFQQ